MQHSSFFFLARLALHSDSPTAGRDTHICCHFFCLEQSFSFTVGGHYWLTQKALCYSDTRDGPNVVGFIERVPLRESPYVRKNLEVEKILSVIGWNVDVSESRTARCSTANCANLVTAQGYLLVWVTTLEAHRCPPSSCSRGGLHENLPLPVGRGANKEKGKKGKVRKCSCLLILCSTFCGDNGIRVLKCSAQASHFSWD